MKAHYYHWLILKSRFSSIHNNKSNVYLITSKLLHAIWIPNSLLVIAFNRSKAYSLNPCMAIFFSTWISMPDTSIPTRSMIFSGISASTKLTRHFRFSSVKYQFINQFCMTNKKKRSVKWFLTTLTAYDLQQLKYTYKNVQLIGVQLNDWRTN